MTDREDRMNFTEDQVVALLAEHYEPVSPPAGFEESLLAEVEAEFRRLHSRGRRPAKWNIFRRVPVRRLAIPAALVTVAVVLTLLALFPTRNVLAQVAERMKGVRTLHYTLAIAAMPEQGVQEFWSRGDKTYCRRRVNDRTIAESWIDSDRLIEYDREKNRVVTDSSSQLQGMLSSLQSVYHLQPADWKVFPQQKTSEGGQSWLVCEMPDTKQFSGLGSYGDTRYRLWINEKTALPGKLESLLRSSPSAEWKPLLVITFLWDELEVPDSLFEPKYPADAKVTEVNPGKTILTVSKDDGKTGITLERAWIHPAGLVILRCAFQGRVPCGEPPRLADPSKNPWGLKPEEIPQVIGEGQLLLDPPAHTEIVAEGGMADRWAGYAVFWFTALPDGKVPVKLKLRQLLARTGRPGEVSMELYADHVLNDPSAWEFYEFSIPIQPYLTDQIPEEIYASPNLRVKGPFLAALRGILRHYEAQSPEKALQFLKSQGPHTQELLSGEMRRLTGKGSGPSVETTAALPEQKAPVGAPVDSGKIILTLSKDDGETGITLEKAWIHPAGLVIFRCALEGRVPFGEPPHLADPSKNPWGLKPEEIPQVIGEGQLLLEPPAQTEVVAAGGMADRWAGYVVFRFSASPDGKAPVKLKFRQLLGRIKRPGDGDFKQYVNAVLNDPSSWELYEFSIPTQPYLTDQIPEEIYASPNLLQISKASFTQALRSILRDYEAQSPEKALQFLRSQGPHTQELLRDEMQRLTAK